MDSPNSCLSWVTSSEENDLVCPSNPWFDYYQYVSSSPTISVKTDPNWGRELNSEDEEIEGLFDLQLDLQDLYIENLFPSSDEESLDDADLKPNLDNVHSPLSCLWICTTFLTYDDFGIFCSFFV